MANSETRLTGTATIVREEDLTDMEDLQHEIEEKIQKAHDDGRAFMMAQYVVLLAKVKVEVGKLRRRFDRESLAGHRSAARALKKTQRGNRQNEA